MVNNKEGLKNLINITKDFKAGVINAPEYFKEARIIIFNQIALKYYNNESDLIQDILECVFNNRKDILNNRILIDLCINECNLTIQQVQ